MTNINMTDQVQGPTLRAFDPWRPVAPRDGKVRQLLNRDERARLAVIASIVRFEKDANIYRQDDKADAVFTIISGVVKAYEPKADGSKHISAFLFPDDVFGLAEDGCYANSAQALTPVTAYQLPIAPLRGRLTKDASLEYKVICKLCHELRQAQRHAFLLAQRRAVSKVALFLQLIDNLQGGSKSDDIELPMSRTDIGEYVGMSLAAVSRAFHALSRRGIIKVNGHHHIIVTNPTAFHKLAGELDGGSTSY